TIMLRLTAGNVLLQVKDDGVGFVVDEVKKGLGINNIKNRVELFGGKVLLTSSPGKGCEINIFLPHGAQITSYG
ncbi:MAG TPA: ATP-binding protein, partial [Flavisolibacter sp.]|nr:ATP-binding protein [Flavisolibacter sp.]